MNAHLIKDKSNILKSQSKQIKKVGKIDSNTMSKLKGKKGSKDQNNWKDFTLNWNYNGKFEIALRN